MPGAIPTATTVLDSILFRDALRHRPNAGRVLRSRADRRYIEVEIALAKAEARCGVIPAEAAEQIAARIAIRTRSTSTCCARRPTSSATRSCRSCTSS